MKDFLKATVAVLSRKGIVIVGLTVIPNGNSDMPFATGSRGYKVNDNGCLPIWTFNEVMGAVK